MVTFVRHSFKSEKACSQANNVWCCVTMCNKPGLNPNQTYSESWLWVFVWFLNFLSCFFLVMNILLELFSFSCCVSWWFEWIYYFSVQNRAPVFRHCIKFLHFLVLQKWQLYSGDYLSQHASSLNSLLLLMKAWNNYTLKLNLCMLHTQTEQYCHKQTNVHFHHNRNPCMLWHLPPLWGDWCINANM